MTAPGTTITIPTYDPMDFGNRPGDGALRQGGQSVSDPNVAMASDAENLPSTPSPAATRQRKALTIARDLWAGPERVRDRGADYLPRHPAEQPGNWSVRLQRSVFFNFFGQTVRGLTGLAFRRDPVLGKDVPEQIAEDWENIDNAGTHGAVFAREIFQDALIAGHAAILVEYANTGDQPLTLADEQELGLRPYWVPITKDQIVSWRTVVEHGHTLLAQLVLKECTMEPVGEFGMAEVERYRIFRRAPQQNGTVAVTWELVQVTSDNKVVSLGSGKYANQVEIPVAEIKSSGRKSIFDSEPPLIDLAFLNIAHYQEYSDARTSRHMTCVPILFTKGIQMTDAQGQAIEVGPNAGLATDNPAADAKYVSHDGQALSECRLAMNDLRSDIATLGLSMLAPDKRAAETAEAKRIDKSTHDSSLAVSVRGCQDGLERALGFHARYYQLDMEEGGSVTLNRDFELLTMSADDITALSNMVAAGQLSIETMWERLKEGNVLPDDFDPDDEKARIAADEAVRRAVAEANTPPVLRGKAMPAKGAADHGAGDGVEDGDLTDPEDGSPDAQAGGGRAGRMAAAT